jgi:hypothetical protein
VEHSKSVRKLAGIACLLSMLSICGASSVYASTIFLAGSEAASFHHINEYTNPVFRQLQGTSTKGVLVIDNFGATAGFYADTGGVSVSYVSSLDGVTMGNYSALFFASPGTCCSDPYALLGTHGADVADYVEGGGSLYVEDYQGNAAWNPIIGLTVPSSAITSGAPSPGCSDPGVSTANGLAFGFAPSYSLGCFQHQTYDPAYWSANGYFALQIAGPGAVQAGDWVTMATGFAEPITTVSSVPEPASATLMLTGIGMTALVVRRRKSGKAHRK